MPPLELRWTKFLHFEDVVFGSYSSSQTIKWILSSQMLLPFASLRNKLVDHHQSHKPFWVPRLDNSFYKILVQILIEKYGATSDNIFIQPIGHSDKSD